MAKQTSALCFVFLLMSVASAAAAPPSSTPAPLYRQAIYVAAQAAFDAGDWDKAIAGFTQVLASAPSEGRAEAIIRGRLAEALVDSDHLEEGKSQAARAVKELRGNASGPDAELASAYLTLADAYRFDLSYDEAIDAYGQARTLAEGPDVANQSMQAALGLIISAMVVNPDLAASTADSLIADQAGFQALSHDMQAQILSLRARAELNRGQPAKAKPFIDKALALSGPLRDRVTLFQMDVRSDAALIYGMLHNFDKTREYLAYAGAGHIPHESWFFGSDIDPPVCGPDISPDDTAVVEFAIADDGRTAGAAPIYASRPGPMGVAFARAVREWRWRPEAVAKLDMFWRAGIRVELRCMVRPPPLSLGDAFYDATREWLRSKGITADLRDLGPRAGEVVESSSLSQTGVAEIPVLFRRLAVEPNASKRTADLARLHTLFDEAGAPPEARALLASAGAGGGGGSLRGWAGRRARALEAVVPAFDQMDGGQRSAAWLRTEMAIDFETSGDFAQARSPLVAVVNLPSSVLAPDDPIRSVAVLHLSLLDRLAGNPLAAKTRLNDAGLTTERCDLLDVHPILTRNPTSDNDFPPEAQRWGFQGWAEEAFDIGADGVVKNVRTVIAYPPFVFGQTTEKVVSRFRYLPPTLGDTALGCTGRLQTINYRIAGFD